jgi:hypothetical protein
MAEREQLRKKQRLESLEGWRKDTAEDSRHSQDQFDKALMTLSASGLGATIAFLDKIVPFSEASLKWLLFLIWTFWALCLAATVFSFYASNRGLTCAEAQIAEEWKAVRDAQHPDSVPETLKIGGKWNTITKVLNEMAAILFGLGLLAMMVFIGYNLFHMPDPKLTTQQNEGLVAASRPPAAVPLTKGNTATPRPPAASVPAKKDK